MVPSTSDTFAEATEVPGLDWDKVREAGQSIIKCRQFHDGTYPDIQLHVALKPVDSGDPGERWNNPNVTRFDLVWDKRNVVIPRRFWDDIARMPLQSYPEAELQRIPAEQRWKIEEQIQRLRRPNLSLSAGKGTVMIEWTRGEECDSSSTFRWLITKGGIVLRHHDFEYHEC